MLRSFTLIEILITFSLLIISLFFISPIIFNLNDKYALQQEIANIQSFIYQIQTKARYTKKSFSLTISQDSQEKRWCIIAIQKSSSKQIICDCLHLNSCALNDEYYLYQNQHQNMLLKNKSLYPKSFINIDGLAARLESKCINISRNKVSQILQFDQWGRVYVMPENKRSTCKD